ncbi:MAG: DNA-directed RNA polymerase subunit alpha [bacterium]
MLEPIYLPENVTIEEDKGNTATFSIYPYHPGYGPTVGNALRRVLLSSLPGAAITHIKIEGVDHEFSTLPGVKEDVVSLILNLKRIRLSSESEEPVKLTLSATGEKKITAKDFETPPGVEIANDSAPVATLTDKKAKFGMTCTVERGRGYVPSEAREHEQREIGTIALDAIFTPVTQVSFKVKNVRVGQVTDYHKLVMAITTDGTISPKGALSQAASILADHFRELTGEWLDKLTAERPAEIPEESPEAEEEKQPENTLNMLQLPSRVHNALERVGITTVEQVIDLTEEQVQDVPGLGEKAVQDIIAARDEYLKSQEGKVAAGAESPEEDET